MHFEVLGPLRVLNAGRDVTPRGRGARTLLCGLLMQANQPVRPDTLAEMVWPDSTDATAPLHVAIHRLRKLLDDPDRLELGQRGYRLRVEEHESDVAAFDRLAAELMGQSRPEPSRAREALALWRGAPFEGIDVTSVDAATQPWVDRRHVVEEMLFESEISAGRSREIVGEVEAVAAQRPLDERLQGLLVKALHASGRTADALAAYSRTARTLRDELGLDPGPDLQDLQARILAGDPVTSGYGDVEAVPTPAQLPPGTDLVGRADDLVEIDKHLADGGICVLTGAPGVGKTALAVHWGQLNRERFTDGQLFVDLRGFSEDEPARAADVAARFLRALGRPSADIPTDPEERSALLRSHLAERRTLLVLDNARSADQVRPLLPGAGSSGCAVLVTSRETLSGLSAREGAHAVTVGRLDPETALALLGEFAGVRVHEEPGAGEELVRRCARLPLALRIAAEQIRARPGRSIADLVTDLSDERDRLDLLDTGDGSATAVRAVFSWSYESLPEDAALVFRHLGLIPGQDTDLHSLAALCGRSLRETRRATDRLVRAHLLEETPQRRFAQHDLLKAYAAEGADLIETEEGIRAARARHLGYYANAVVRASLVRRPERGYAPGPTDAELPEVTTAEAAVDWLQAERLNAVAVARAAPAPSLPHLVPLARALGQELFDVPSVAEAFLETTRDAALAASDDHAVAYMESALGVLHGHLGNLEIAEPHMIEALAAFQRSGDEAGRVVVESNLARVAAARGNFRAAIRLTEECLAFERERDNTMALSLLLTSLGEDLHMLGRAAEGRLHLEEAVEIAMSPSARFRAPFALCGLSRSRVAEDRLNEAMAMAQEALEDSLAHDPGQVSFSIATRGFVHLRLGDTAAAKSDAVTALRHARRLNDSRDVYEALELYAFAVARDDPAAAVPYFRQAIDQAASNGFAFDEATAYVGLAEACAEAGDPAAEGAAFTRAREIFGTLDISQLPE